MIWREVHFHTKKTAEKAAFPECERALALMVIGRGISVGHP